MARLRFIGHARAVGFSLAQTAELLRLQAMHDTLQSWHDACRGDTRPECCILQALAATAENGGGAPGS